MLYFLNFICVLRFTSFKIFYFYFIFFFSLNNFNHFPKFLCFILFHLFLSVEQSQEGMDTSTASDAITLYSNRRAISSTRVWSHSRNWIKAQYTQECVLHDSMAAFGIFQDEFSQPSGFIDWIEAIGFPQTLFCRTDAKQQRRTELLHLFAV